MKLKVYKLKLKIQILIQLKKEKKNFFNNKNEVFYGFHNRSIFNDATYQLSNEYYADGKQY